MSVHDHRNDPINKPPKHSESRLAPVDRSALRKDRMGGTGWMIGFLALVLLGGILYTMTDRTKTATNTAPIPPASTNATPGTTGSGTNPANDAPTTPRAASPNPAPVTPSPNR